MTLLVRGPWARRIAAFLGCCLLFLAIAAPALADEGSSQAKRKVIVGVTKSFPPYYEQDEDGKLSGFAIDVMNVVAKRTGLTVTYLVVPNAKALLTGMQSGDIDIIPSLGISDHRKQYVAFTQPVDTFRVVLFVRDDTQDIVSIHNMKGRPVAVVVDNVGYRFLKNNHPEIQLKVFPLFSDALFALLSGHVDAFAYPEPVTWKLARKIGVASHLKTAVKPLKETKRAMAVRKDKTELLAVLNREIGDFIKSPEYQKIYLTWFGKPVPYWTVAKVAWAMTGVIVFIILFMGLWRYQASVRLIRALGESEKLFKSVINNSPTFITLKDTQGRYKLVNQIHTDLFGLEPQGIVEKTIFEVLHKKTAEEAAAQDQKVIETKSVVVEERPIITRNGTIDFLITKFPILGSSGAVTRVGTIGVDISARKQAEKALKTSEARLAGILDIAPEAVIAIGENLNIRLFNQGAERIFGYKSEEVIGKPLDMLMPERSRKGHGKHVRAFDNSDSDNLLMNDRTEVAGLRKDGTEFPASASVSKLEIDGQKIFTVLLQDITESKEAEEAVIQSKTVAEYANYAKTQFLANMSHELRTPLNSIIGFSQILKGEGIAKLKQSQSRDYATDINNSANHLLALIQDILDVSKIEAGELELDKEPLDFNKLIDDCLVMVEERAKEGGIKLSSKIAKPLPTIEADKVRIKQILLNLMSNAIKFTPDGGTIEVEVKKGNDGKVLLMVDDTGIGIDKKDLKRVLEPFCQVKDIMHRNHEGTGLGLSLAKSLTELHGGNLALLSEIGKGTTAIVELPYSQD